MMDYIKGHKLIAGIILLLLVGAAWWELTGSAPSAPLVSTAGPAAASSSQDAQLVATLLQLQAVSLNGTVLSDPGFLALQDFTTQIVSEPIGRQNPFAPISGTVVIIATTTQKVNPNLFAPAKP